MERLELLNQWIKTEPFLSPGQAQIEELGEEHTVVSMSTYPTILNPVGTIHGGALYTFADDVAGIAATGDGRYYVTQSGTLNYLRNQIGGRIRAKATVLHRGSRTCVINVDIYGETGKLLATGDFNFFLSKKQPEGLP